MSDTAAKAEGVPAQQRVNGFGTSDTAAKAEGTTTAATSAVDSQHG